jgi:hypothetical protein
MLPKLAYYVPPSYLVEFDGFTTGGLLSLECSTNFLAVRLSLAPYCAPKQTRCASATKLATLAAGPSATNDGN